MSAHILSYVTLRDYKLPNEAGWAVSLVRLGYPRLRAYLEDASNLKRTEELSVDSKSLAGDLFDLVHRASPSARIDLDTIPDGRLLYYGWRFPITFRRVTKRAA
jgi:hypothetical protein